MPRRSPWLYPYRATSEDPFDRVKAAHLLNRAGFGGTPAEIERVLELGPGKAVDWLLDFPDEPAEQQTPEDVPDLAAIEGYPRTFREIRNLLSDKDEEERRMARQMLQRAQGEAIRATAGWWLKRMAYGPHPLQEKLALFWHGHFTTSAMDTQSAWRMWQQNELLRRHAAGHFPQFLQDIARDPAMLDYLNNQQNRRQRPNENFARELLELFTLGIGNYTEQDIREAARAFTGWAHDGESFEFRRGQHDDGEKTFLGRTGKWGGDDVIGIILEHPACAPYIGAKLYRYFVEEDPDERTVRSLGDMLRAENYQIRPLLRQILRSRAFYRPETISSQIKSPIQLLVGTIRLLELPMPPVPALIQPLRQMGQVPFYPPNVQGWPGGRRWINSSTLFVRYNTAVRLAGQAPGGEDGPFRMAQGMTAEDVVSHWVERLIQRPVEESKRSVLAEVLGERPRRERSVRELVQAIVSMPEYQLC